MSKALTTAPKKELQLWDESQAKLLKNTVAKGLTDEEFMFFSEVCKATGLNPLLRQIYCTIHKDQYGNRNLTLITGIDGIRKIAHSTGVYAGRDKAIFKYDKDANAPSEVEVTVYKIVQGVRCGFTATAVRDEYLPSNPKKRFMWNKMKEWMLEKCCEAKALRMAFTQELSGIYEEGEAHQIGEKDVSGGEVKDMNELVGLPEAKPEVEKDVEHEETVKLGEEEPPTDEDGTADKPEAAVDDRPITPSQRQRLFAISRSKGWKDQDVRAAMKELLGFESTKQLTLEPYDFLVGFIREHKPEAIYEQQQG